MGEESYEFFKYFDLYMKQEQSMKEGWNSQSYTDKCILDVRFSAGNLKNDEVICAKFKCFYNLLLFSTLSDSKPKEHVEYLNFWLNDQLKNNINLSTRVNDFYQRLKLMRVIIDVENELENKIYDINEEHFTNMKNLHDLYSNYSNIKRITEVPTSENNCLEYSEKCVETYTKAIKKCSIDTTIFCRALKNFKEKYDEINNSISLKNCKEQTLLALPDYNDPSTGISLQEGQLESDEQLHASAEQASNTYFSPVFGFIGTILGIFFTLLIMYKYTPLISGFFRGMVKEKKINTNLEEVYNQEILLDNSDFEHNNSDNMSYNIIYNPTLNS
ncbi:PIR Superfamily Protein [Plasmodium ovale wallikeri]|uniref:PIR Superfamily Protein n=2 Tax=Plasmodium ovale TaxID=36330 RepID=A0A1A9A7Z4_PLAOA|nr:PIR Superfamily Protein [Plasmodium ovale wallikeri]SBT55603.1 PIR Superfamily Protein [Plasmodium ovale wallikeri]SBT72759.1 Plasmodium vivax Vir protein, putative [Plasmodium ovale]